LSFDGHDDLAQVQGVTGLDGDALTVEVWFTPAAGPPQGDLLARRAARGARDSFLLRVKAPGPVLEFGVGAGGQEWGLMGHSPLVLGQRSVAAATHDRRTGQVRLYLDGKLEGEGHSTSPAGTGEDLALWLGGDPRWGPTGRPFSGRIHAACLFDQVRDAATVAVDAQTLPGPDTPGLRWRWTGDPADPTLVLGVLAGGDASDPRPVSVW